MRKSIQMKMKYQSRSKPNASAVIITIKVDSTAAINTINNFNINKLVTAPSINNILPVSTIGKFVGYQNK